MKKTELKNLWKKLLGIKTCWDDLLKALDDKEESLLAKKKEINLSSVEEKPDEPVALLVILARKLTSWKK